MNKLYIILILFSVLIPLGIQAQCPTDLQQGQNLVTNGNFSQGYTGWSYTADPTQANGYLAFNPPTTANYSTPGMIDVGTNPNVFNSAFGSFGDHTTGTGNMLMCDGICVANIDLWRETNIPIIANTNYYFSVWITSLDALPPPGTLAFNINGTLLNTISAPGVTGDWIQFTQVWNSGPTPPATITIAIQNTTLTGCNNGVDFAIDDISFTPGCLYGSPGPIPNLGPTQTICGTGGSITLNANVPETANTTVTWNDGTTGIGLSAPYTKVITAPGTYSVCVDSGGSCTKSSVVVITNTYSINLGPNETLCNPTSYTLNAGFSGPGVTYQWYDAYPTIAPAPNTAETYLVNTPGTYSVYVTDPICGTQSSSVVISTVAATPTNGTYCTTGSTVNLSVSGPDTYNWYSAATGGTLLASGTTSYTTPALTAPTNYTYYVQDMSTFTGSVGLTTLNTSGLTNWGVNASGLQMKFQLFQNIQITSIQVPMLIYSNGNANVSVTIYNNGTAVAGATFASSNTAVTTAQSGTLIQFNFPAFNLTTSMGTNLSMAISAASGGNIEWNQGGGPYAYPYNSNPSGVINLTGGGGSNATINDYPHFYNVQFQAGTPCARVPVTVTNNCAAPVTWTGFYITPSSNSCKLNWSTANETNNQYFTIERSDDGINFTTIGTMSGAINSTTAHSYSFTDTSPLSGTSYYRICQHDINGNKSCTQIEAYNSSSMSMIQVFPNPFQHGTSVIVTSSESAEFNYTIYSVSGQLVEIGTGKTNEPLVVAESVSNGMYMLTVNTISQSQTTKIVKH
jgi:hypothetical protein